MSRNVVSCVQPARQGNNFELIPTVQTESQHSIVTPTSRDFFCNHFADISAWSPKSLTTFTQKLTFLEKKTPYGQIFKNVFWKDSPPLRSTSCVQILWNLADHKSVKLCVIYRTKIFPLALASAQIAPKICQGQLQIVYSEYPKCHPNLFTSVIAGRVNIVEMRHEVFPILSEVSSPRKMW